MRLLVCGGRDFHDRIFIRDTLDRYVRAGDVTALIMQGGGDGADELARCWALQRGIPNIEVPALWDWHGKAAGPIRNAYMIDLAKSLGIEMVIAFPGGRGTADLCRRADAAGISVQHVTVP